MKITRNGSVPATAAPGDYFTGSVRFEVRFAAEAPARLSGAVVSFAPGARTAWHSHPLGQTLYVLSGCGRAQRAGGPVETISPGDIVWFAPGERHWHGAAPGTAMSHLAVAEADESGSTVEWQEPVSDADYGA